jgi:hypothetical protein
MAASSKAVSLPPSPLALDIKVFGSGPSSEEENRDDEKFKASSLDLSTIAQLCSSFDRPTKECTCGILKAGRDDGIEVPLSSKLKSVCQAYVPSPPRFIDLKIIILTLPDPNETGLSEEFDSYYNAFQRAAPARGLPLQQLFTALARGR